MTQRVLAFIERAGVRTSFVWGFAEATLFFLLPDIAIGAVGLTGLKRALRAAVAAIGGAVLGGAVLYIAARWAGPGVRTVLDALPAIPTGFFTTARADITRSGGPAIVEGPAKGIPYKLYVAEWALAGKSLVSLLLWTVPARAARFIPVALVSWLGGMVWRRVFGPDRTGLLLLGYLTVWIAIYTAYFTTVGL